METMGLHSRIERSILRPDALPSDVHRITTEALQRGNAAVVLAPVFVRRVATMLSGATRCATAIAFPHGSSKSTLKAIEATSSIKDGADQIDVVPFLPNLMRRDVDSAKVELLEVVRAARATRRDVVINVIIEAVLVMSANPGNEVVALADACRAVRESGCDGVVTSTGFHPLGDAGVETVAMMRKHASGLTVKATGRELVNLDAVRRMIEAGADCVGVAEEFVE